MKRRQFLKYAAAIAAVVVAPFRKQEEWTVSWFDRYSAGDRYLPDLLIVGTETGRFRWSQCNFEEIEKRVAAQLIRDGKFHRYGYNSDGEVFVDGKQV